MVAAVAPGWHGKMPSLGDFATRRLDADFVSAWDEWLSDGLARLRREPDWPAAYLASPSWRFLLLPGVLPGKLGEQAWAGVLMPSVDRVGRYYPLTIVQAFDKLPADAAGVEALWTWLLKIDEAAADALHDDWPIETLEAELARLPAPQPPAASDVALPEAQRGVTRLALGGLPHAGSLLLAQAALTWRERSQGLAFWSAQADLGAPRVVASPGLERGRLLDELFGAVPDNAV
jgi:type VI secretion system protein ImpM